MTGKVAIVTGASRGIGHAIAIHLAQQGARLVLCGRDEKLLAETSAKTNGGHAIAIDQRAPEAAPQARNSLSADPFTRRCSP